jgi:ubiquinone/menaquinone biosynthesis C-methylase UbiE
VLEIGCGIGRIMYHVAPHCRELHGVDISAEMVRQASANLEHLPNVRLHVGNGFELPAQAEPFDLAYSCRVFQHIPKNVVLNYLKEAHRVLKPGAKFALQIPNILIDEHMDALNHFSSPEFFSNPYPMYFYTPAEIVRLGSYVGFDVEVVNDWLLAILTRPVN